MSHGITVTDNMFAVGRPAWHGLGVRFDEPPSIADALKVAAPWSVSEAPVFTDIGGTRLKIDTHKAIVRDDTGAVLGIVGRGFVPLQNPDAFGFFAPLVERGLVTLETAGTLHGGARVWVMAKLATPSIEVVRGDVIDPYVLLCHGNDGSLAVRCGSNPVRVVCANTLAEALGHGDGMQTIRHTSGMLDALAQAQRVIERQISVFKDARMAWVYLSERACSAAEFERFVLAVFAGAGGDGDEDRGEREPKGRPGSRILAALAPLFEGGAGIDLPGVRGTWWAAYNAVTEFLSHHRGRKSAGAREAAERRFDQLHFGEGRKLGHRAMALALAGADRSPSALVRVLALPPGRDETSGLLTGNDA